MANYTRVSIFMSVFDVHINRAPIAGRVKRIAYVPGKFVNADLDKASEDNERQHFLVEGADGLRIGFTQIAGLVARRILAFVARRRRGRGRPARRPDPLRQPGRCLSAGGHGAASRCSASARSPARRSSREIGVDVRADRHQPVNDDRDPRRIPFRAMIPNAITALALCLGLTGVSLAIGGEWEKALGAIVFAGVLDGLDGRIARLLRAQSKFGAELDSLADNIAFGTAPALILFLWSLQTAPRFGWIAALGAGGLLRASTCPLQRADRCRRAAAQVGRLQHRRSGTGRRGAGVRADLSVADHRQRALPGLAAGDGVDAVHRRADDLEPADLQLVEHPHPARLAAVRAGRRGACSARP